MANLIDGLLSRDDVIRGKPADQAAIDTLSKCINAQLPKSLLKLWSGGDGIALEAADAHLLGPTEILKLIEEHTWDEHVVKRGFVPLLDDHQSNYLAVIVRVPLAFRVAYLPHDDGSRLLYRDLEGFARALAYALDAGESADMFFYQTQGDYPPEAPRPKEDQQAALALMATDGEHEEWNYAAQLLDASNLSEWAKLLETDQFVRRDVVARIRQMREPAIQELLKRNQAAFAEFARATAEAARKAGLSVGAQQQGDLQVGGEWLNLEGFFYRRNIPNAMPRMIAWFEDLIAGRNPHDRPGHFMADGV